MVLTIVRGHDNICIPLIEPAILLIIVNDVGYISQRGIRLLHLVAREPILFKMVVDLGLVHDISGLTAHIFNNSNDI